MKLSKIKQLTGIVSYTHGTSYIIGAAIGFLHFVLLIYVGINRKVKYIEYISASIKKISKGNLDYDLMISVKFIDLDIKIKSKIRCSILARLASFFS